MRFVLTVIVLSVIELCFSQQYYPFRSPLGLQLRSRSSDGSVKGGRSAFKNRPVLQSDVTPCDPNDDEVNEDVLQALKDVIVVGDRDLFLSEHDGHQAEHCNAAKRSLKKFVEHLNCVTGPHERSLRIMASDLKKMVRNRCDSKEWHDKYIQFSKCLYNPQVQESLHTCHDHTYEYFEWIISHFPPNEQQQRVACCNIPFIQRCIRNKTAPICGNEIAEYAVDLFFEPFRAIIGDHCNAHYLNAGQDCSLQVKNAFERIDAQKNPVRHTSFYKLLFKVIKSYYEPDYTSQQYYSSAQEY